MAIIIGNEPDFDLVLFDVVYGDTLDSKLVITSGWISRCQLTGIFLGATCLFQFAFSMWMDSRYEKGLAKNYFWMIWYPFLFWVITVSATIVAMPKVLLRNDRKRARWVSPDRGVREDS